MSSEFVNYLFSVGLVSVIAVWLMLYIRTSISRNRQWLIKTTIIALAWSAIIAWWIDYAYQFPVSWLGAAGVRFEAWLILGLALGILADLWSKLPTTRAFTYPVTVNWPALIVSAAAIILTGLVTSWFSLPASLGALTVISLSGLFIASQVMNRLLASLLTLLAALLVAGAISFALPLVWPSMAGHFILSWWSVLDIPSLALAASLGFGFGPLCWWWLGQPVLNTTQATAGNKK